MSWHKDRKILNILIPALVGLVVVVLLVSLNSRGDERKPIMEVGSDEIMVEGKISCMPLKSGTKPVEVSCVKGIAGDDGKFYALDTMDINRPEDELAVGTEVQAIGKFSPIATSSPESQVFLYDGVLVTRILYAP